MSALPLRYRWSAWSIGSDIPLPLPPSRRDAIDFHLRVGRIHTSNNLRWYHGWEKDGGVYASFGRDESAYVVRFDGIADTSIDLRNNVITVQPHSAIDEAVAVTLSQALPLAAAGRGFLVLHASAVECGQGAVLFTGAPGAGKSTLAAVMADDQGCAVIADDIVVFATNMSRPAVFATHAPLRLAPDAAALFGDPRETATRGKMKTRFPRPGPADDDAVFAVAGVCVLDNREHERVSIRTLPRREAAAALLPHIYRLDTQDRSALTRELDQLTALTGTASISVLTGPQGLQRIGEFADAVARQFGA